MTGATDSPKVVFVKGSRWVQYEARDSVSSPSKKGCLIISAVEGLEFGSRDSIDSNNSRPSSLMFGTIYLNESACLGSN